MNNSILATDGEVAVAGLPAELISARQYRTIKQLADGLKVSADQVSHTLYDVPVDELSQSGAKDLIAYLRNLKGGN